MPLFVQGEDGSRRLATAEDFARWEAERQERIRTAKGERPGADHWWEDDDDLFDHLLAERMTSEQAATIRTLREEDATWRAIARYAYDNFGRGWRLGWTMPSHQGVGIAVCRAAVLVLGDDPDTETWWC